MKASGRSTGGSLTVMELAVDGGPPRHTHTREDESFYVFTGVVDVECGEDRFEAGPGSFVFLPRSLPHARSSMSPGRNGSRRRVAGDTLVAGDADQAGDEAVTIAVTVRRSGPGAGNCPSRRG